MTSLFLALGDWLGTYTLHSTVILVLALGATALFPRRCCLHADAILKGALFLPVLSSVASVTAARWKAADVLVLRQPGGLPLDGQATEAVIVSAVVLWMAIASVRLRSLRAAYLRQIRDMGPRVPLPSTHFTPAAVRHGAVTLTMSQRCLVPFALDREVCLPARALHQLNAEELRSVVTHELTHIERRDPVWRVMVAVVVEVFFFQGLNRFTGRRIRELSEWICDARTSSRHGGSSLASALARVADWSRDGAARPGFVPSLIQGESLVVRRVRAALEPLQPLIPVRKAYAVAGAALAIAAAVSLPGVGLDASGTFPYTVNARDDAGPFTVTLQRGNVLGVSIAGSALPAHLIDQRDRLVAIQPPVGESLRLTLTPRGGFTWRSRRVPPASGTP